MSLVFPRNSTLIILVLWVFVTAMDVNKAFHIDDAFHLYAAQWIEHHPATPMSGMVNWGDDPEPIHHFNQPPGFFYLVALTGHLFGYTEVPMHLMRSLFTLLALVCFYRLARHRSPRHAVLLTALFALCPAFMVNQGLMTDTPLLAMTLLFADLLLVPRRFSTGRRYALAGLALAAALAIKYTALPLLVVFLLALALRRQWRWLPMVLIPVALLAGWSAWNLHEFGSVHLFGRQAGDPSWNGLMFRALSLSVAFGAIAPFTPAFLPALFKRTAPWIFPAWLAALAVACLLAALVYTGSIGEAGMNLILRRFAFALNGLFIIAFCVRYLPRSMGPSTTDNWILAAWAVGFGSFLILFSPFLATRHVLLLIPPVLLLIAPALDLVPVRTQVLAVACTAVLGVLLTVSDKAYAGFFRKSAPMIAAQLRDRTSGTVWSLGHWGWQWYSQHAGMSVYGTLTSDVHVGDILVVPQDCDVQAVAANIDMEPLAEWVEPASPATFFNVEQFAGMYASGYAKLPWSLNRTYRKTIIAYQVVAVH